MMQRQGQDPDGESSSKRAAAPPKRNPVKREPFRPGLFFREVRSELRQVAWPNRAEVVNYTSVTLITLLSLMALIFLLNYGFAHLIFWLYNV
jgi:preprotein translocase subunit SecE